MSTSRLALMEPPQLPADAEAIGAPFSSTRVNAAPMPRIEAVEPERWPSQLPPVRATTMLVDSRQRAWLLVHDDSRATGDRYDLLDASGKRIDAIRLPAGVKLLGMGRGVFYATREDGDGLVHLLRFPLP